MLKKMARLYYFGVESASPRAMIHSDVSKLSSGVVVDP